MPYKIINWERYQSRTDGHSAPWVKLHRTLLLSDDFFDLPKNIRWQWPCLLLLAEHSSGIIERTDAQIARALHIGHFDPKPFIGSLLEWLPNGDQINPDGDHLVFPSYSSSYSNKEKKVDLVPGFDGFWILYPRKVSKQRARDAWKKLAPDTTLQSEMKKALALHCKSREWTKNAGEFIPHPATWLNQKLWGDVLTAQAKQLQSYIEPHRHDDAPPPGSSDEEVARYLDVSVEYYRAERGKKGTDGIEPVGGT